MPFTVHSKLWGYTVQANAWPVVDLLWIVIVDPWIPPNTRPTYAYTNTDATTSSWMPTFGAYWTRKRVTTSSPQRPHHPRTHVRSTRAGRRGWHYMVTWKLNVITANVFFKNDFGLHFTLECKSLHVLHLNDMVNMYIYSDKIESKVIGELPDRFQTKPNQYLFC